MNIKYLVGGLFGATVFFLTSGCSSTRDLGGSPTLTVLAASELPPPERMDLTDEYDLYSLGPFDKLTISIDGQPEFSLREIIIDANGNISVPPVGSMRAGGLTPGQLEESIKQALKKRFFRDPQVSINLIETTSHSITIDGQVKRPGIYPVAGGMTLMKTVALAQGVTENVRLNDIVVFRNVSGQQFAAMYDLGAIRRGRYPDPPIYANDVIMVGDAASRRLFKDLLATLPAVLTPVVILLTQ